MKTVIAAIALVLALPALALADPSTTPNYTAKDQAQFAKLAPSVGTWTCKDNPANKKPDTITGKQSGNYYVWTETGDQPNTTYARWNHALQAYTQVEIDLAGSTEIYMTKSLDPFNATWSPVYPTAAQGNFPFTISFAGNQFSVKGSFKDAKGKVIHYTGVCTKS